MEPTAQMSEVKDQHVPQPIRLEDFEPGHLKERSHSIEEISAVLVKHNSRGCLTTRQHDALERFKYQGNWNLGAVCGHYLLYWDAPNALAKELTKFFDIFNDFYFNGVLEGYCKVSVMNEVLMDLRFVEANGVCWTEPAGWSSDPRFKKEKTTCTLLVTL